MKKNDGGPAFPFPHAGTRTVSLTQGMSLRAYLAGQAISGIARPGAMLPEHVQVSAYCALAIADAIIEQLEAGE